MPVLALKRLDESAAAEVLGALAAVIPPSRHEMSREDATAATAAAARRGSLRSRAPLWPIAVEGGSSGAVQRVELIAVHDEAADACAGILQGFHADARDSIEGVDYDARLGAYDECTAEWFFGVPSASVVPC